MPNTYKIISSNTLTTSAASVTFSGIPSTFNDLILKWSVRDSNVSLVANMRIYFNGTTGTTLYSNTFFRGGNSSGTSSTINSDAADVYLGYNNGSTSTTNTFSSGEIYLPNYTSTANRPFSSTLVQEHNATDSGWRHVTAGLFRGTSAISEINLTASVSFLAGSSFYLYGISKS